MSQIYKSTASGPPPPGVMETLTGDDSIVVGPDGAGNINVLGDPLVPGITTRGDAGTNTLYITPAFSQVCGTGTTVDVATSDLITLDLGATPGSYTFHAIFVGKAATASSGGGRVLATVRTDGATATVEETPDIVYNSSLVLAGASITVVASGNNAILRATGALGTVISWKGCWSYLSVENGV